MSGLSTASMILAAAAAVLAFIPVVNVAAPALAVLSLALGAIPAVDSCVEIAFGRDLLSCGLGLASGGVGVMTRVAARATPASMRVGLNEWEDTGFVGTMGLVENGLGVAGWAYDY